MYLGFHEAKAISFSANNASTERSKPCFPIFSYGQTDFFPGQKEMAQCFMRVLFAPRQGIHYFKNAVGYMFFIIYFSDRC